MADAALDDVRTTILLNMSGHSAIEWDAESDETMQAVISQKMAEGVVFFRLKKRLTGSGVKAGKPIETIEDAMKRRAVAVKDKDFAKIIVAGQARVVDREEGKVEVDGPRITDPAIVARTHTVALQPRAGG